MPRNIPAATIETEPYPGLKFYEEREALFFAGREDDIKHCAILLLESRVLILHGRTGCGKSSFLRAGVKPRVTTLNLGVNFSKGFVVVRSTDDPLRQLVSTVMKMTRSLLTTGDSDFGPLDEFSEPQDLRAALESFRIGDLEDKDYERAVNRFCEDGAAFVEFLNIVLDYMEGAPIFVIDQGEEVFTMAGEEAEDGKAPISDANADIGRNEEAVQFFRFLHKFATSGKGGRIVVSLRTEWKGLFDDRISENGPDQTRKHPGATLAGYYLKDLEKDGLIQAIIRPTLKSGDKAWKKIVEEALPGEKIPVAPFDRFRFEIDPIVVSDLADALLGDEIPFGGVLPTMQVACLRLWRQASQANRIAGHPLKITRTHFLRLGQISDQIEEFLAETVEDACSIDDFRGMSEQATTKWLHELSAQLVEKQADGRAVTRAVPRATFHKSLTRNLPRPGSSRSARSEQPEMSDGEWKKLIDRQIDWLRNPKNNILKQDVTAGYITLGHDSLALALRNWSIRNPQESMAMMMMRMGMGASQPAEDLTIDDLFLKEDPPHRVTIFTNFDYVWDRHLPEFARLFDFGRRLGINFRKPRRDLNVLAEPLGDITPPKSWNRGKNSMVARLLEYEKKFRGTRTGEEDKNNRVMVVADWGSFPGDRDETAKKDKRESFAGRFSDILVTNVSVGNQLIGQPDEVVEKARDNVNRADTDSRRELLDELIFTSLSRIRDRNGVVYVMDTSGQQLLVLATKFIRAKDKGKKLLQYFSDPKNVVIERDANYSPEDPLISKLLSESEKAGDDRPRYIVGSSSTYAMAIQCGFQPYFGTKALAELGKYEMVRRQTASYEAKQNRRPPPDFRKSGVAVDDIPKELQSVVTHTLWQLGIEPAKWRQGLNRATVLRLASVGYYTSDYVRAHMDRFIAYIQGFVSEVTSKEAGNDRQNQHIKGTRLNQKAIKEALKECFHFYRFDEYGSEIYDLDARLAYWTDHGAMDTKSVAGQIYAELVQLRHKTIESFGLTAQAISWMRGSDSYDPSSSNVALAFRLKELAWNHFRIFNFFDSERYMSLAAHLLQDEMEKKFDSSKKGIFASVFAENWLDEIDSK